jgi:hypothetical protein
LDMYRQVRFMRIVLVDRTASTQMPMCSEVLS